MHSSVSRGSSFLMDLPTEDKCKLGRVASKYELSGIHAEIKERRIQEGMSLRELARFFNRRVLDATVGETGADVIGDPESIYRVLTDEDVPRERRAAVRDQLEFNGVDLDELEKDFVSHELVRQHLRDCLGVKTDRTGVESITEASDLIDAIQEREHTILERTLERLQRKNVLSLGEFDMTYTTRITCTECGQSYTIDALLDNEGCECPRKP